MSNHPVLFLPMAICLLTACSALQAGPTADRQSSIPNYPPQICTAEYHDSFRELTITVLDEDDDDITVGVTRCEDLRFYPEEIVVTGGAGTAVFEVIAADQLAGADDTVIVHVDDGKTTEGEPAPWTLGISIDPVTMFLRERELAAIPLQTTVRVGEPVTVLVRTGMFPKSAGFTWMDSMAVTIDHGGDYIDGSLNAGAVGGAQLQRDGIWQLLFGPLSAGDEELCHPRAVPGDPGREYMQFSLIGRAGRNTHDGGDLFNFQMEFARQGSYRLGFLLGDDEPLTHYTKYGVSPLEAIYGFHQHYDYLNWIHLGNDIQPVGEWPGPVTSITVIE